MSDFKAKMHQILFRLGLCPSMHVDTIICNVEINYS